MKSSTLIAIKTMSKVSNVVTYLCSRYPHKGELSKARVTKLVYLADWTSAQKHKRQITDIKWFFHNYGPYVDDVIDQSRNDPRIEIETVTTIYGDPKTLIKAKPHSDCTAGLDASDLKILDQVIQVTQSLFWDGFIQYIYNTYPIKHSDRHRELDLLALAQQERESLASSRSIQSLP
jgi:hypothetical protein